MSTPAVVMKPEPVRRSSGFQWKPVLVLVQQRLGTTNLTEQLHEHIRKIRENRLHHARNRLPSAGEIFVPPHSPRDLLLSGRPDALQVYADSLRKSHNRRRAQSLTPTSPMPSTVLPVVRARRSISSESPFGPPEAQSLSTAPGALLISVWIVGGVVFGIIVLFLVRLRQLRRKSIVQSASPSTEICIERL